MTLRVFVSFDWVSALILCTFAMGREFNGNRYSFCMSASTGNINMFKWHYQVAKLDSFQ
jgi:hypothetical protein